MSGLSSRLRAVIATEPLQPRLVDQLFQFRKSLFVDGLGWDLQHSNERERDQFDTDDTVHVALLQEDRLFGSFRAVRTDRPYLAHSIFPHLATERPYPQSADVWEISRFGVAPEAGAMAAKLNYSLMFWLARQHRARSLVALADLTYERFLWRIGVRTQRYGDPQAIGHNATGKPIIVVAGEIPLALQRGSRFDGIVNLVQTVEISDETLVLGRQSLSA